MDTQAVPVSNSVFDSFKQLTEKPVIKKVEEKQRRLAALADSDSFQALKDEIDGYILHLGNLPINPEKDTVESVGFRYLAAQIAIDYLRAIRDLPDRTKAIIKST